MRNPASPTALGLVLLAFFVATSPSTTQAQDTAAAPSVLLPVYAVDLAFAPDAVDGSGYPSASEAHPNAGTSELFQQIWMRLKPSGFSALRFPVDVSTGDAAVYRVANLCAWANREGVSLLPVLVGGASPFPEGYDAAVAAFVTKLGTTLRGGGEQGLASYPRLLMFQLGDEINHPARNGRLTGEVAAQRAVAAAAALRKAEQAALDGSGLYLTPILVAASFDVELVTAGAAAVGDLEEGKYLQAYGALREALAPASSSADVDGVAVTWYPGSVSAGGVERLGALARSLATDVPGKQLVVVTGLSTAFRPAAEQKQFATLAFTNLAELRASGGAESPLLGVVFHKALGMAGSSAPPAGFEEQRQAWTPQAMSSELMALWRGEQASPAIAHWDAEVDARMGLLAVEGGESGTPVVAAQPALDGLEQVAEAVAAAPAAQAPAEGGAEAPAIPAEPGATPPGEDPAAEGGHPVREKVAGILGALLDQVLTQLGNELSNEVNEEIAELGGGDEGGGSGGETTPGAAVKILGASCTPTNPKVNENVSCLLTLRNDSGAVASDLSVALLDSDGYLLGDETSKDGISVAGSAQSTVTLPWKPAATGAHQVAAKLYDETYSEIASADAGQVTVKPATGGSGPGQIGPLKPGRFTDLLAPKPGGGGGSSAMKPVKPGFPLIGALTTATKTMSAEGGSFSLPVANSTDRMMSGLVVTLEVDGEKVAERRLRTLLPGQSHTVTFSGVKLGAAKPHEAQAMMSRQGGSPLLVGVIRLDAARVTRGPVRTVGASPPTARPVRPTADAARVAAIPGAVSRTASAPGSRLGTAAGATSRTTSGKPTTTGTGARGTTTTSSRQAPAVPPQQQPLPRPDLTLGTGLRVSPSSGPPGQKVSVQAVVSNAGSGASGGAVVTFQVRGARGVAARGSQRLGPIPARGRASVGWSFPMPAAGNWQVEAVVQSEGDANRANDGTAASVVSVAPRVVVPRRPSPRPTGRSGVGRP